MREDGSGKRPPAFAGAGSCCVALQHGELVTLSLSKGDKLMTRLASGAFCEAVNIDKPVKSKFSPPLAGRD
jgi:hypothetical protein